jgi:DNA polymerase V
MGVDALRAADVRNLSEGAASRGLFRLPGRIQEAGIAVRSSNYTLYGDMSARVMRVLSGFTPNLEIYSIDEAFLGLFGFEARLEAHARELRQTVLQWTGIPVSVGIAPTKSLAKVANRLAKTDGVRCLLDEASQREALARLELTDLWGIAGRLAARLSATSITTPLELRDADHRLIRERFNVVLERMVLELRGDACIGLEDVTLDRKSLIASRSFAQSVETRRGLEEAVSTYTAQAAEKMRCQNLVTAGLAVWIESNSFKPEQRQYDASKSVRLPVATADTGKLIAAAITALGIIFKPGYRLQEGGRLVSRSGAIWPCARQPVRSARRRAVGRGHASDRSAQCPLRPCAIGFGTAGERQAWSLRREFASPRFTTDWNELLRV